MMAKSSRLKMEYWPIEKIRPYANNAKEHPDAQISQIRASFREFGVDQPLLLDKDGEIIAGHGRLESALADGIKELPVIVLKHLTKAQVMARRIADNSIPLGGTWKQDLLELELAQLNEMSFDLAPLGLDAIELPEMEDIEPAPPRAQRTKTTIFVSIKNADAAKARKAIIAALKTAKIEHNL